MNVNACEDFQERLLDLVEEALDPRAAAQVRAHLETCPACRDYYAWLTGAATDLEALGDALVASAAPIDIVQAVMDAVEGADRAPAKFSRRRPAVNWRFAAGLAGLAAAAAIALFVWLDNAQRSGTAFPGPGPNMAKAPGGTAKPTQQALKKLESSREILAKLEPVGRPQAAGPKAMKATQPPDLRTLSFDDVVRTRKKAVGDEEARAQLVRWASLTPDDARKLLKRSDISAATVVAAAQSLDAEEASTALLTAVGRYPDNSHLRFETAAKLVEKTRVSESVAINPLVQPPEDPTDRLTLEQIQAWQDLDPSNALPYYLQADVLLRSGDLQAALEALRQAQQLGTANVYALDSAQARQEALTAGGMPADTARLLAALTAGNNEYNFLYTLSNDLLEYGRAYAEQNSLPEAQQIFESVSRLGEQVASGANFSLVESAGLYAQQQALQELQGVYAALGSEEAITRFQSQTMELFMQIEELNRYMSELNTLFASPDVLWSAVTDAIMQVGDLNIFDHLSQTGQ